MTSIADRGYDAFAQGFPDSYDRADGDEQIPEALRPAGMLAVGRWL